MKEIQDITSQYARKMPAVFADNLCLFFCYCYIKGVVFKDAKKAFDAAEKARLNGYLGDDGFVLDGELLLMDGSPYRWSVEKKQISSLDEIASAAPVCYSYNGHSHWVVAENGKIVFNSLGDSACVKYGKPVSARIVRRLDF